MAFITRAIVLLAIALCLQGVAAYPKVNNEKTSENFPLLKPMSSTLSFSSCKEAGLNFINHFVKIHSIALEYVTLTSHVTSQSLRCFITNSNGIIKCISGVMSENQPSYDLLHQTLKALFQSLLWSIKDLVTCPFK